MQTFLPLPDFAQSAQVLDRQRLGKQRVETYQLLCALSGFTPGWANHPAAKMWKGCTVALAEYGLAICEEWRKRGYKDSMMLRIKAFRPINDPLILPSWFGDPAFHASHRSNLLRKDPNWYGKFGWTEPPTLNYIWPTP